MAVRVAAREREALALRLRAAGATYAQIGARLGGISESRACHIVRRALARVVHEPAEELRELEGARLDLMQREAMRVLRRRHVVVSHGRIVRGDDGRPLVDDGPTLAAIGQLLRIQERRARLFGLDAPTKHEVLTLDAIEAEIVKLERQLGHRPGDAPSTGR